MGCLLLILMVWALASINAPWYVWVLFILIALLDD